MSESFFGFDTSLPAFDNTGLATGATISEEKDVDGKNDETFGGEIIVPDDVRQEDEDDKKKRIGGMSIKEILTQEYQKSKETVSLEEEMEEEEIIENSISQLGLDDDVDESESKRQPHLDNNDASWVVPPQGTPERASLDAENLIQDILSPDKRGIWTSPGHGEDLNFSPSRDSKQPDLLKQLFSSAKSNSTPETRSENRSRQSADVIKAEELEKGLTTDQHVFHESPSPVIIERRMPRTPAPPPGFPFPIGTPPSGLPWMTPPGILPMNPMMLAGQMQHMFATSPHMAMLRGIPPPHALPRGRFFEPRFGIQGDSAQRGRYTRGLRQRKWEPGSNRYHGGGYQRRQWNNNSSFDSRDEEFVKLPPSNLMTSREKEWLVKIQLMTLISDDVDNTDYYYVNFMYKKAAKMEEEQSDEGKLKKDAEKENFNKLLDIVEQKKEERKYRPAVFEGSLGKPSVATVHHPRQIVVVSSKETEDEEMSVSKAPEGMKKRFNIYGSIEKAYTILLNIEDIDRKLLDVPDIESDKLVPEKALKIEMLFNAMKLSLNNWQKGNVNELFVQLMCISKGKRLFFRSLRYFSREQKDCASLSVVSNLQILTKKDSQEKALLPFLHVITTRLSSLKDDFLSKVVTALLANNLSQLFLYSFGITFVSSLFEKVHELLLDKDSSLSKEAKVTWDGFRREVSVAIDQISSKNLGRHSSEMERLTVSLNLISLFIQPHCVEE